MGEADPVKRVLRLREIDPVLVGDVAVHAQVEVVDRVVAQLAARGADGGRQRRGQVQEVDQRQRVDETGERYFAQTFDDSHFFAQVDAANGAARVDFRRVQPRAQSIRQYLDAAPDGVAELRVVAEELLLVGERPVEDLGRGRAGHEAALPLRRQPRQRQPPELLVVREHEMTADALAELLEAPLPKRRVRYLAWAMERLQEADHAIVDDAVRQPVRVGLEWIAGIDAVRVDP